MIIDTFKIGHTTINIHNDYLPKNEKEQKLKEKALNNTIKEILKNKSN